jgi:hypothetical protein
VSGSLSRDFVKAVGASEILANRCWGGFELAMAPADNLAQIWIAVSVCVLVAIVWKTSRPGAFSLHISEGRFGQNIRKTAAPVDILGRDLPLCGRNGY